jgi:hypothetical protein
MTGPLGGGLSPYSKSVDAIQLLRAIASVGSPVFVDSAAEWTMEDLPEEWRIRFHSLQDRICELLIKNQQLRMALIEIKARESVDCDGHDMSAD